MSISSGPIALAAAVLLVALAGCGERSPGGPDREVARMLEDAAIALHPGQPGGATEAAELYRAALAREPGDTEQRDEARFGLAQAEMERGRRWAGQWSFARLAHESPRHAGALSALGILAYEENRFDDCLDPLSRLAAVRPLRRDELLAWAESGRRTNRFWLAESLLTVHLEGAPDDAPVLKVRGWVRRRRGDLAAAQADLARAAELTPQSLEIAVTRAEILFDLARPEEARVAVAALFSGDFAPAPPADSARAAVLGARVALEDGRAGEALRLAGQAARQNPANLDALQTLVRAHRARGDLAAARAAGVEHRAQIRALKELTSALASKDMIQGAIALEEGRSTGALEHLRRAIREDPVLMSARALHAPLARDLGHRTEARESFGKLREASGGNPPGPIFMAVGLELRRRGLPAVAARQFQFAAARLPGDERPIFFGALSWLEAGDEAAAYATAGPLEAAPGPPAGSP